MKRLFSLLFAALFAFAPLAQADLRASSGAFGPVSVTGGNVWYVVRSTIPFFRTPTGTMGNNGAYTSGTAYAKVLAKCYLYFAANQIAAGVAAGWYYAEGSSTTAFTVFNNTYTSGTPTFPASKTAFVTTGTGAITGDITEQAILLNIPANQLGPSGGFRLTAKFSHNNTAGTKNPRLRYSGLGGNQLSGQTASTSTASYLYSTVFNQQATNVQEAAGWVGNAAATGAQFASTSVDTTAATTPAVTMVMGTATDWIGVEWWTLEFLTDGT